MKLHLVDQAIIIGLAALLCSAAWYTKQFTRSVADFLSANRCAGKYVIGVAEGVAAFGAVSIVGLFEAYYIGGFSFVWWGFLLSLATMIIAMTGWVQYRYRQTRCLTMAQFFEQRYSKRFRITTGVVIFLSGTLNFAIFPAVGARFFMYFCGIPSEVVSLGIVEIDLAYAGVMVVLLGMALFITLFGGQVAVIVTDFIQGVFFNIFLCVTALVLLFMFPWPQLVEGLSNIPTPENSLLHPFHSGSNKDFNLWFYLITSFGLFYSWLAWQGQQGYYSSALSAHEARMGRIIGSLRDMTQRSLIIIIPMCAYVVLHHSGWGDQAVLINSRLDAIEDNTLRAQLTTTVTLRHILPAGLAGAFAAMMFAAFISTHDTYLHSWGSIFIQDILMPFTGRHIDQAEHLRLLRRSIIGVALFIFLFSLLVPQEGPILLYFAITGTMWLGGAGAIIIGGLYWKRGTTAGAYGALITGFSLAVIGFAVSRYWPAHYGTEFPVNNMWIFFIAMIASSFVYIVVSLAGRQPAFDLDRLLRRGIYSGMPDDRKNLPAGSGIRSFITPGPEFSNGDKWIFYLATGWSALWAGIFLAGTAYNLFYDVPEGRWALFWKYYMWFVIGAGTAITVWFAVSGWRDLKNMFKRLDAIQLDEHDDGTVKPAAKPGLRVAENSG